MFSTRDMWPSTNQLGPGPSRSQRRVVSEDLDQVEEQVDDDVRCDDVEEDKDKDPEETDEEAPLSVVQ